MVTEEKLTGNGSKYRKKRETDHEEDKSYLKQVKIQKIITKVSSGVLGFIHKELYRKRRVSYEIEMLFVV